MQQNDFTSRYERKLKLCGVDVQTVRRIGKADRYEEVALVPLRRDWKARRSKRD